MPRCEARFEPGGLASSPCGRTSTVQHHPPASCEGGTRSRWPRSQATQATHGRPHISPPLALDHASPSFLAPILFPILFPASNPQRRPPALVQRPLVIRQDHEQLLGSRNWTAPAPHVPALPLWRPSFLFGARSYSSEALPDSRCTAPPAIAFFGHRRAAGAGLDPQTPVLRNSHLGRARRQQWPLSVIGLAVPVPWHRELPTRLAPFLLRPIIRPLLRPAPTFPPPVSTVATAFPLSRCNRSRFPALLFSSLLASLLTHLFILSSLSRLSTLPGYHYSSIDHSSCPWSAVCATTYLSSPFSPHRHTSSSIRHSLYRTRS